MAWCEANGIDYVFGLPGNKALHADPVIVNRGDACATDRALQGLGVLRHYAETCYAAKCWGPTKRRVVAFSHPHHPTLGKLVGMPIMQLLPAPEFCIHYHFLSGPKSFWPSCWRGQLPQAFSVSWQAYLRARNFLESIFDPSNSDGTLHL